MKHPWLVWTIALVVAVAVFIAAVVTWRMFSTLPGCPPNASCAAPPPPHRLHPLRAELLWAASGFFVLVAVGVGLRQWRRRRQGAYGPPSRL